MKTKKPTIYTITIILTILILTIPHIKTISNQENKTTINIALYECGKYSKKQLDIVCHYQWTQNNTTYQLKTTSIDEKNILKLRKPYLTNENFDVLIIGSSAKSYLIDGLNPIWKNNIKKFISNGGGYIGICGGANAASQGFQDPQNLFQKTVNKGVLNITNVYINDRFLGEWQYLLKIGIDPYFRNKDNSNYSSYVSTNTTVHQNNPIFSNYKKSYRHLTYGGGPGMYPADKNNPKLGKITPILTYNEEPMNTHPIHFWKPTLMNGWKPFKKIETNISNTHAAVATTYNSSGRIALYGPHPEYPYPVINGTIKEYFGHGFLSYGTPLQKYVYNYFGKKINLSYNIWILRRSIAWVAHVPSENLPPISETTIWLDKPAQYDGAVYINGELKTYLLPQRRFRIINNMKPIVIENITLETTTTNNIEKVEFYIDNKLEYTDTTHPYRWNWNQNGFGKKKITAKAYDHLNNYAYDTIEVWKLY